MTIPSSEKFRIEIANEQVRPFDGDRLISAVSMILAEYGFQESEISIAIVDDPRIRQLNKTYLDHDYETDVISFTLETSEDESYLSGQLIVSSDTAARLASELQISMDDELLLYVVHGTLHLVGLNDKQPDDAREMRAAEKACFEKLGVPYHWPDDPEPPSDDPEPPSNEAGA